jgi:pre-mRNA-splicing factor ISY1
MIVLSIMAIFQLIREISKAVGAIQNGSLGEHKIRDMNDHINKLMREKKHWERQIKYLGGADYLTTASGVIDADGNRAMGANGYFYFGAARDLPGTFGLYFLLNYY